MVLVIPMRKKDICNTTVNKVLHHQIENLLSPSHLPGLLMSVYGFERKHYF
jgi:hypothetical protein